MLEGPPEEEPGPGQDTAQHCLWVDEFAPQHYTELLSDDVSSCSPSSVTGLMFVMWGLRVLKGETESAQN